MKIFLIVLLSFAVYESIGYALLVYRARFYRIDGGDIALCLLMWPLIVLCLGVDKVTELLIKKTVALADKINAKQEKK